VALGWFERVTELLNKIVDFRRERHCRRPPVRDRVGSHSRLLSWRRFRLGAPGLDGPARHSFPTRRSIQALGRRSEGLV
jgi:hypothetical protein